MLGVFSVGWRVTSTSRKGSLPSASSSFVNMMLGCTVLLNAKMNYHVMRATLHILARLSIPCVRGSFLGLMLILNLTKKI